MVAQEEYNNLFVALSRARKVLVLAPRMYEYYSPRAPASKPQALVKAEVSMDA